ncbi:hypothetical protein [Loigolactobacillus coryniformis]|uniref:hypothetical protein n=1 Tax=Loigolactobacillus coryniformis TaxID=1610 RepID=UPI00215BAB10|nr:hypothetical protein [Loigolactobacillus coryniformis]
MTSVIDSDTADFDSRGLIIRVVTVTMSPVCTSNNLASLLLNTSPFCGNLVVKLT